MMPKKLSWNPLLEFTQLYFLVISDPNQTVMQVNLVFFK
jgi:hypothetical protein